MASGSALAAPVPPTHPGPGSSSARRRSRQPGFAHAAEAAGRLTGARPRALAGDTLALPDPGATLRSLPGPWGRWSPVSRACVGHSSAHTSALSPPVSLGRLLPFSKGVVPGPPPTLVWRAASAAPAPEPCPAAGTSTASGLGSLSVREGVGRQGLWATAPSASSGRSRAARTGLSLSQEHGSRCPPQNRGPPKPQG